MKPAKSIHPRIGLALRITIISLVVLGLHVSVFTPAADAHLESRSLRSSLTFANPPTNPIYLPSILRPGAIVPRINVPNFGSQNDVYDQSAIFWFGQVRGNDNYSDVRVGYNSQKLWVRITTFDRYLWYDPSPSVGTLTQYDGASLYLDMDGNTGNQPGAHTYRFDGQLNWWEPRADWQASYQGSGSGYVQKPVVFQTYSDWRGDMVNTTGEDRAYMIIFHIPFASLGLSGPPPAGTVWGVSLSVHDRDDAAGTNLRDVNWPQNVDFSRSQTWNQLSFGLPSYSSPVGTPVQTITIRDGLNGITVPNGVVGGNSLCGQGLDYWSQWGDYSYTGARDMNVQNQGNEDDWPCFSKMYITFPLGSLPPGKVILSATLTLHQSGQATGFPTDPPAADNSLIQVMEVSQDWSESTLSWNDGPQVMENVSQAWVGPITMADYGIARTWDVGRVTTNAYSSGKPLRLVLYSADAYGPHGKYFISSHTGIVEEALRPSLVVVLGNP